MAATQSTFPCHLKAILHHIVGRNSGWVGSRPWLGTKSLIRRGKHLQKSDLARNRTHLQYLIQVDLTPSGKTGRRAAWAKQCHLQHRPAHQSPYVTPTSTLPQCPPARSDITASRDNSRAALILERWSFWCKLENPLFPAKMGAEQHLQIPEFHSFLMLGT
eukprot:1162003-Pelagomonas_calceolata.AAC.1